MLGRTPLTLVAELGAAIERGDDHRTALDHPRATGEAPGFEPADLYPDARPALERLRGRGISVAIAGNFGRSVSDEVASWGLAADAVVSAHDLGAEKPDPAFFVNLAARLAVRPEDLVYAGDRIDNDVLAGRRAGCRSIFVRRGPWAAVQERKMQHDAPAVDELDGAVDLIERWMCAR